MGRPPVSLRSKTSLNILEYIPYRLIIVDSELPGICGMDFVRILHNSGKWQPIELVVMASSRSERLANEVAGCGAFLVRKSKWRYDLFSFLAGNDKEADKSYASDTSRCDSPFSG
jgi:hypothetical protein